MLFLRPFLCLAYMQKKSVIQLKIEKLALGGRGIGFFEGVPVFVDDAIPGDVVEAKITKWKKTFAEAKIERAVTPSGDRVPARCKHFGICGGCGWQFLSYEKQLAWKEQLVKETLEHVGGFENPPVEKIIGCGETAGGADVAGGEVDGVGGADGLAVEMGGYVGGKRGAESGPWFYRNKMEWSFDRPDVAGQSLDSKNIDGKPLHGGFHVRSKWHEVVNVEECFLQSLKSVEIFQTVRDFFVKTSSTPRSVYVREGKRTGEMMVVVMTLKEEFDEPGLIQALQKFPEIISIAHVKTGTKRPFEEKILFGKKSYREEMHIRDRVLRFDVRPQAFFQPNTFIAEKIYEKVLEFADPQKDDFALDLFCGTGTIGLCLAPFCHQVDSIESDESAIKSALENAQMNGIENVTFRVGLVQELMPRFRGKPGVIILDPPRAGVPFKALQKVALIRPRKIVYVSCNPATFARDAQYLKGNGYRLCTVQPFDQFPQTAHIELVASFSL